MGSHSGRDLTDMTLIALKLDHLRKCNLSLKNKSNVSIFTYNFFQELNEACLRLYRTNTIPKKHTLNATNSTESIQDKPIESCEDDTVNIIQQVSQELFLILCQKSNINQNVQKMVSITFINTLSLICSIEVIIKLVIDILHFENSKSNLTWVWTNLENDKSHSFTMDIETMFAVKLMLSAGTSVRDWWHVIEYESLVMLVLSFLSSHCSNKYLHHLVFSLQALKHCLDHSLKHNHDLILESLQSKIFEVILGNWENYIPSVMDHNLLLCESFISVLKRIDEVSKSEVQKKRFWDFLTNVSCTLKSKYYMMAACFISDFYYMSLFTETWFLKNMAYSLSRSYLVTAGAYCHKVLVKNIFDENRWKEIFLGRVVELVCHSNISIRQNVCNYWLPTTVKQFPSIIQTLYELVLDKYNRAKALCLIQEDIYCKNRDFDQVQIYLHAVILIIKLERPGKFNATTYACVQDAMRCSNEMIRADAFLCCQTFHGVKSHVSMDMRGAESCQVFEDMHRFLKENINCDDPTLRQTVYKVFKNYVVNTECQLRKCVVPLDLKVRRNGTSEPFQLPDFMHNYIDQYEKLYKFFTNNLSTWSNYQRLITTLNLLNILFENITFPMTENQKKKRRPTKEYLKEIGKWHFESSLVRDRVFDCLKHDTNDVRVMAKHLLISYFNYTSDDVSTFLGNLRISLEMNESNVFYTAESGAYGVTVVANLFYKAGYNRIGLDGEVLEHFMKSSDGQALGKALSLKQKDNLESVCRSIESLNVNITTHQKTPLFSSHFLRLCLEQADQLQADIVFAVKHKNSLHGSLTSLMFLLTDPASPEFCALDATDVDRILHLLRTTCLHLLDLLCMKSKSTNFAPSFGEMGEAMEVLINAEDDSDQLTMTPAHQTVFNCIWMNLKTACTFASELAVAYCDKLERNQIVFACQIISQVLHKCRHKGAIQNAGLALGSIVSKCLYEDRYPLELLEYTLRAVLECTPGGTVSRKSAGVAILVHKLLASEHALKEKLFETALDKLLDVASSPVVSSEETLKIDVPQVIAFHMLQFIVADAGLRVPVTSYLERITNLCLDKMQSQEWTVRNAALQVFGALLPKLVGTKKQDAESQSSNVAFEEFFYQLPRIGVSLRGVLSGIHESNKSVLDFNQLATNVSVFTQTNTSVLVSALTLLSRLKITGDLDSRNPEHSHLKHFLSQVYSTLLASNMHTIRFLVANCYVNSLHRHTDLLENFNLILFACLEYIFKGNFLSLRLYFGSPKLKLFLQNNSRPKIVNENHLHGSLLTLEILKDRIYLEDLKLDTPSLIQILTFLNTTIPLMVDDKSIKPSTYSLLFKIFRNENERLGPRVNEGSNVLNSFSDSVEFLRQETRVGWKLFLQEVVKFQMYKQLFIGDTNIDFSYITRLVCELCLELDILKNALIYLLQLLREYSVRNVNVTDKSSNGEKDVKICSGRINWVEAYKCIKQLMSACVSKDCNMINTCSEQVFNLIIKIYNMFAKDSICSSSYDYELLHLGSELFTIYCTKVSVEYICPAVQPVLSLCVSLLLPEGVEQYSLSTYELPNRLELLDKISNFTNAFIHDEKCNEEYRYNAAVSMTILYSQSEFRLLTHDIVANTIYLLQDEVYEVRQEITYFVRKMEKNSRDRTEKFIFLKNPYIYLFNLLKCSYTVNVHVYLDVFSSLLFITEQDIERYETDSTFCNPFDHNLRNFYSEPMLVAKVVNSEMNKMLSLTQIHSFDKIKLSNILGKCRAHVVESSGNVRLNDQGREKLKLLNETERHLEKILV